MRGFKADTVDFSYPEKFKSAFSRGKKIYRGGLVYTPTVSSSVLLDGLLLLPLVLLVLKPIKIFAGLSISLNFAVLVVIWTVLMAFVSPLFTRYRLMKDFPSFAEVFLERFYWGAALVYSAFIFVRYYDAAYLQSLYTWGDYIVAYFLPVLGVTLTSSIIVTVVSYLDERRKNRNNQK